jgi:hypothetical protein
MVVNLRVRELTTVERLRRCLIVEMSSGKGVADSGVE